MEGKDFNEDRKKIMAALRKKKNETPFKNKIGGFSITQLGDVSQQPITYYISNTPYSSESLAKTNMATSKEQPYSLTERFVIPTEFDHLGRNEGESFIGVVHIDGNEFGNRIKKILNREINYDSAVQKIRMVSKEIARIYKRAFQKVIDQLMNSEKEGKIGEINLKKVDAEKGICYLPIRDIVINGDDVTFVCDGRLALFLSYFFLKTINMEKLEDDPISACAGIAIVKAHFPFYRAYQIAEQCCQSAKKKAKLKEYDEILSWLDFHVVSSGITGDLETTRRKHYQVAEADSRNYHLLWRPWLVSDSERYSDDSHNFQHFIQIYQEFTFGGSKWPRNKLKQLEFALSKGKLETASFLSEMESRGFQLPIFPPKRTTNGFTSDNQTPYYDVLEMLDFFQILEEV
ncbi:hypothetical protein [Bacillus smithii]|uniref:hypothetical protein n=1 Tax=Bacillus smithii TaxID=1479 RepID=UPI0030C9B095